MGATAGERASDNGGALRRHFLGWQCRIRQHAVRHNGGRPGTGMRPRLLAADGEELAPAVTVLIVPREPAESIALFRYQVMRTHDPAQRYQRAVEILSSTYFQHPAEFSDVMTAAFGPGSVLAATLVEQRACILEFAQFNQNYRIPCTVGALAADDPSFVATFWHNCLFNSSLPGDVSILSFEPDWPAAAADPPTI
ncbi:MAG: hypothetical protein GY791_14330 [Alphaproteobacteria bacterium]|nr:hypothetical protein [Alphaproteobacteria bacterium]